MRGRMLLALAAAALAVAGAAAAVVAIRDDADGGDDGAPAALLDGSLAFPAPFELDEPSVRSAVRVRRPHVAGVVQGCAAVFGLPRPPVDAAAALRIGVDARTITYRGADGRLYGCDAAERSDEPRGVWCGASSADVRGGRATDPRLSLANCRDATDEPLALAWYEAGGGARWVGVRRNGYVELYEVVGDLPIRLATTSGIDVARSAATFDVIELDAAGRELRRSDWRVSVAG